MSRIFWVLSYRRFVEACSTGNMPALLELRADDITPWSDSGGKGCAQPEPRPHRAARFFLGVLQTAPPKLTARLTSIHGQFGIIGYVHGHPIIILALNVAEGRIKAVRILASPEELKAVSTSSGSDEKEG